MAQVLSRFWGVWVCQEFQISYVGVSKNEGARKPAPKSNPHRILAFRDLPSAFAPETDSSSAKSVN